MKKDKKKSKKEKVEKDYFRIFLVLAVVIFIIAIIQGIVNTITISSAGDITSFPWYSSFAFALISYSIPFAICVIICIILKLNKKK